MIKRSGAIFCSALLVTGCSDSGGSSGSDPVVLEDLLGRNILQWQFSDTPNQFAADVTFTEQSILEDENGDSRLAGMARTFTRESMNSEFISQGEDIIICAPLPEGFLNLCLITAPSGALSTLIFGGLVNGQADGNFEFCDVGQIVSNCVDELLSLTLADGPMFIANTAVPVIVPSLANIERDSIYSTYTTDTMRYLEQGTRFTDTPDGRVDFTEINGAAIVEAVRAFTASTNLSTLDD